MGDARFEKLSRLLDEALELPEAERESHLRKATPDDPELLTAALAALREENGPADAWRDQIAAALADPERPGADRPAEGARTEAGGRRCGPWRLVRSIGSGGMGEVFLAERADGAFEQRVAIKLLPAAVRSAELAHRLERERQILARLEHPNIARLIDGGLADDGTPYLALEYVEGISLLAFAAERRLGVAERLALFLELCDAVSLAHAHLVVHRDLKPSNVMASADGRVKLLDFGIAKLLEEDDLGLTRTQNQMLTPRYAAPEQIEGRPATTATDVHALGLLLFELLAGVPAFGRDQSTPLSVAREIVERDPPPPSTVVGRAVPSGPRAIAGDLDAICLRALRKLPGERYGSVAALAEDVRRALAGEPVSARSSARLYRASRFARRHAWSVTTAALVFVSLAAGLWVALRQRDRARSSEARARAVQRFFVDDLLLAATPEESRGRRVTVEEALETASRRASSALEGEPELEHHVRGILAEAFLRLDDHDLAAVQIERERQLAENLELSIEDDTLAELRAIRLDLARGEDRAAAENARALEARLAASDFESEARWLALAYRGLTLQRVGNYAGAEESLREAEAALGRLPGAERARLEALQLLVANLVAQRKDSEAEVAARRLVDETTLRLGEDHPDRVRALDLLAQALRRLRRRVESKSVAEQAVALGERVLSPDHSATIQARFALAFALWDLRQTAASEEIVESLLEQTLTVLGPDHPTTARAQEIRAIQFSTRGEYAPAEELYARALATTRAAHGELHPVTLRTMRNLVLFHRRRKDEPAARAATEAIFALARRAVASERQDPVLLSDLAFFILRSEPPELRDLELARGLAERAVAATDRRWADALSTLSLAHELGGDPARAIALLEEACFDANGLTSSSGGRRLHDLLDQHGPVGEADRFLDRWLRARRARHPGDASLEGEGLVIAANHDLDRGRIEAALAKFTEADRLLAPSIPATDALRIDIVLGRAAALERAGRTGEARAELLVRLDLLRAEPTPDPVEIERIATRVAALGTGPHDGLEARR